MPSPGCASKPIMEVVELFDPTVTHPPFKIRLEQLQTSVRNLLVPALSGKSEFDLSGILKGVRQGGRVTIDGWAEVVEETTKGLGGAMQGLFGSPKRR